MKLFTTIYHWVLLKAGLLERRCGWCKKFQGWKRGKGIAGFSPTTHGICDPCRIKFEADCDAVAEQVQQKIGRPRHQRRSTRTLRRQLGGWGGAVATQQRRARA